MVEIHSCLDRIARSENSLRRITRLRKGPVGGADRASDENHQKDWILPTLAGHPRSHRWVARDHTGEGHPRCRDEASALYAFARVRGASVLCIAHVTNTMGQVEGDFEKGEAGGTAEALRVVEAIILGLHPQPSLSPSNDAPSAS
jgi:hypothetical protein